jgi:hydroxymethylpyrimidine pyrophosphatase-like HAD family hydrolase
MENKPKIIAVDFDGTLCENKWPEIGVPNMKLIWNLTELQQKYGAKLILWTCRSGEKLEEAIQFCEERGLMFDAVNENLPEVIEWMGGDTRKIYADEYIDDRATKIIFPELMPGV